MISKLSSSLRDIPTRLLSPTRPDAMEPGRRTRLPKRRSRDLERQGVALQLGALLETLATHRESEARELYRELVEHPALQGVLRPSTMIRKK